MRQQVLREPEVDVAAREIEHLFEQREALFKQAAAGSGPLADRVVELRRRVLRHLYGSALVATLQAFVARQQSVLDADDLVTIGDRIAPVLRVLPPSDSLPEDARDVVAQLAQDNVIAGILRQAELGSDRPQYQTVVREGRATVQGPGGRTIGDLMGLAHEVGHCLFDMRHGWAVVEDNICSEACAGLFADLLLAEYLTDAPDLLSLCRHNLQREDALTSICFWSELVHLGAAPPAGPLIDPYLALLRPSAVNPGYESIYTAAAAIRTSVGYGPNAPRASSEFPSWVASGAARQRLRAALEAL